MSADEFAALERATPIVQLADGVVTTTSMRVANGTQNEHASVLLLIRKHLADFEEFGGVRFEIAPFDTAGGVQRREVAVLTEEHATLLLTYMRNSDIVRDFKKRLVREFWELRREAETRLALPQSREERMAIGMVAMQELIAEQEQQIEVAKTENRALVAAIERDAPLVAKAEAHTANATAINRQTFAREVQQWGIKQNLNVLQEQVYELLRSKGMLIDGLRADRNHATSHAVKSGWAWTRKDITEDGHPTAVTVLNPRGQDVAWKWITAHVAEFGSLRFPPKITGGAA